MRTYSVVLLGAALFLSACTSAPQQPAAQKDQGRPETKKLEAATAAGYDGAAVRKSVDKTLNSNDDRTKNIDTQGNESK